MSAAAASAASSLEDEAGLTIEEVMEEFAVTREQINTVFHFRGEQSESTERRVASE